MQVRPPLESDAHEREPGQLVSDLCPSKAANARGNESLGCLPSRSGCRPLAGRYQRERLRLPRLRASPLAVRSQNFSTEREGFSELAGLVPKPPKLLASSLFGKLGSSRSSCP